MKKTLIATTLALSTLTAHAEYERVDLTVFGMDCARARMPFTSP